MMSANASLWAVLIGIVYAIWPIIGKMVGANGAWMSALVVGSSLIATVLFSKAELSPQTAPSLGALLALAAIGFANGYAVYVYSTKAVDPQIPTGIFMAIVFIVMIGVAPLTDWLLAKGAAPSQKQLLGLTCAALAAWLLTSK